MRKGQKYAVVTLDPPHVEDEDYPEGFSFILRTKDRLGEDNNHDDFSASLLELLRTNREVTVRLLDVPLSRVHEAY